MFKKRRALFSILIFGSFAWLSWAAQIYMARKPGGDFRWAMEAGHDLLFGLNPYRNAPVARWIPYPLPAALVGIPFCFFTPAVGAGLFFGASAGLLAYCVTKEGFRRLWIFTAMPFWFALVWAQWTPLIMAAAFIPALLPVVLIKPQVALPVGLMRPTRVGIYSCIAVGVFSLIIYPTWPIIWLSQIGQYQRFFPVSILPIGPLLLLALFRWRDPDARFFLLAALFPQRHFYDAFTLWLIPKNKKEMIPTAALSWGAWGWKSYRPEMASPEVGLVSVLFFFLPMLCVLFLRSTSEMPTNLTQQIFDSPRRNDDALTSGDYRHKI